MPLVIPLDSGVVNLLCCPDGTNGLDECRGWMLGVKARGAVLVIADVVDYEVRRAQILKDAAAQMVRLDRLRGLCTPAHITPEVWAKAAEFWAYVRRHGAPTAHPKSLDADTLLAAVAATIGRRRAKVTIATTNVGHLARFPGVDAREWRAIG